MAKTLILKELCKKLGLTISGLEREIGLSNGTISKSIDRDSEISATIIAKLSEKYQNISTEWLKTGQGEMFNTADSGPQSRSLKKKIPIVGEAAAGVDEQMAYTDLDTHYHDQYIDVGDLLRDSEAAFVVYGNSMTPAYPSGCILGIRRNLDGFIQPGETYLLVTKSNRVFKRLFYNDDNTKFVCYSDNTMMHETGPRKGKYAYPSFEVDIETDVVEVYDVIGMIKRNRPTGIIQRQK
jgi:phage repressor protein C with HTH and peptisase S24 domain